MVDDMCFIRSMHTEAINHEPAITYMQTGNQITGRPCLGSWVSYGLGSLNDNLPTFVVLVAKPTNTEQVQAISARLWSSGYLPGEHAGVLVPQRRRPDPLHQQPARRVRPKSAASTLDGLKALNEMNYQLVGDPETHTRIEQYELAFRMQASVPELTDTRERAGVHLPALRRRGQEARHLRPHRAAGPADGRARRPVRPDLPQQLGPPRQRRRPACPDQCKDVDQACWGLIQDLKPRGLLDETLVIWGGEFGRTIYSQGGLSHENYGRDHHPRCFTMWMAGGGIEGRDRSTARPTTSPTTSSRTPSTSATSTPRCCTCSASTTPVHLPLPGPRPAAHRRRAGTRGQGAAGLIAHCTVHRRISRNARSTNRFSDRQREATRMNLPGSSPFLSSHVRV